MNILTPIFYQGELVAFSGSICHLSDIGGASEGGFARDIYEEGFCLPPSKIYDRGARNDDLLRVLARNVRVPQMVLGDIEALIVANRVGAKRLTDLLDNSTGIRVDAIASQIADLTESAMRRSIRAVPAGTYSSHVRLDGYEVEKEIHVGITIGDEVIAIDFAGTSSQSLFGFNASGSSWGYTMYPLKCLLSPDLPNNAGAYRPFTIEIPEGTILNPTPPAGVAAGFPAHMIQAVIFDALYAAMPDRVMAASGAPFWAIGLRGRDENRAFASILCLNGGQGAMHGRNGYACLSTPSNISNAPIEVIESEVPVLFEQKAIARRSGGQGYWRGGAGQDVRIRSIHTAPIS
jgi:N-methylhydantoinase B